MRSIFRPLAIAVLSLVLVVGSASAWNNNNEHEDEHEGGDHPSNVPEIDPGLIGGAVALLASGMLILRDRRRT